METAVVVFHQSTDVSSSPRVPSVSPATKQIRQSYINGRHRQLYMTSPVLPPHLQLQHYREIWMCTLLLYYYQNLFYFLKLKN